MKKNQGENQMKSFVVNKARMCLKKRQLVLCSNLHQLKREVSA